MDVPKQHGDNIKNTHRAQNRTYWNVFGNNVVKIIMKLYYASHLNHLETLR